MVNFDPTNIQINEPLLKASTPGETSSILLEPKTGTWKRKSKENEIGGQNLGLKGDKKQDQASESLLQVVL